MLDSAMERDLPVEKNCEKFAPNLAAAFRGHKGDRGVSEHESTSASDVLRRQLICVAFLRPRI
jgi:hypothetical protein